MFSRLLGRQHVITSQREQIAKLEADKDSIGEKLTQIMDRIGVSRSLSIDAQIGYIMMEDLLRAYYPERFEPVSWRERRLLIADMRAHAQGIVASAKDEHKEQAILEARAINETANHLEGYPYRGWSSK